MSSPQQHDLNDGALMQNFREGTKKIQSQFSTTAQLDEEKPVRHLLSIDMRSTLYFWMFNGLFPASATNEAADDTSGQWPRVAVRLSAGTMPPDFTAPAFSPVLGSGTALAL